MNNDFNMIKLGGLRYFLGLEFVETRKGIMIHQNNYNINDILERYHPKSQLHTYQRLRRKRNG